MPRRRARARRRPTNGTEGLSQTTFTRQAPQGAETLTNAKPAGPTPPPAIYDSAYTGDMSVARADLGIANAGFGLAESRLGYDTGYDALGNPDLSNPYNQAMLLQRSHDQAQRGITNSMASRGMLFDGARRTRASEEQYQYERASSGLQTAAQRGYQDIGLARQGAQNDFARAGVAAGASQADRWQQQMRDWMALYG